MPPCRVYESSPCPGPPGNAFASKNNNILTHPVEWCQLKFPTHCRGGYHPPAREALSVQSRLNGISLKATAKTFPWGKVPRLAGAEEGGGMQDETEKRGAKWYIVRIRHRMCVK